MSHRILKGSSSPLRDKNMFPLAYIRQFTYFLLLCTKTMMAHTMTSSWRQSSFPMTSFAIFNRALLFWPKNFTICKNKSSSSGAFRFKPVPIMVRSKNFDSIFRSIYFRTEDLDHNFTDPSWFSSPSVPSATFISWVITNRWRSFILSMTHHLKYDSS